MALSATSYDLRSPDDPCPAGARAAGHAVHRPHETNRSEAGDERDVWSVRDLRYQWNATCGPRRIPLPRPPAPQPGRHPRRCGGSRGSVTCHCADTRCSSSTSISARVPAASPCRALVGLGGGRAHYIDPRGRIHGDRQLNAGLDWAVPLARRACLAVNDGCYR